MDGLQPRCRRCCAEWYAANREVHVAKVRARVTAARDEHRVKLVDIFAEHPCVDCGEDDLRVLEFDHRPGVVKRGEVTKLVSDGMSWAVIEAEIAKCDVRCANCHRRRTSERAGWWKQRVHERTVDAQEVERRLQEIFSRLT